MYSERRSTVPGAVVWETTVAGPGRVLPDGCMDLIWMGGEVVVAGPDTRPYQVRGGRGDRYVGLRFPPGALPGLLGVPATDLRDLRVPLAEVMDGTTALSETVAAADDPGQSLELFAREHAGASDSRTTTIVRQLREGRRVSTVAEQVNLSARQLHRWSLRHFGYGAKTLARILRFQGALALAEVEHSDAAIAVRSGYADQAHLIRETHDLAGVSFAALVR